MGFDVGDLAGGRVHGSRRGGSDRLPTGTLDLLVLDASGARLGLPADVLLVRLQANDPLSALRTVLVSNGPLAGSVEGRADLVISHPVEASDLDRAVGSLFEATSALQEVYPRAPASPKPRILVVEDNRINQALFLDVLDRSNFSAFAASSGEAEGQPSEAGSISS